MLFRLSCKPHCSKCINTASSLAFAVNSVISCARATLLAFAKCFPILIPTTRCFGFMPYLIPSSFLLNSFSYLFIPPRLTMPQWSICPPIYFSDIPLSLHSVYFLHCQFQIAYFCSLLPPEQIPVWHWTHSASIHSAMVCAFSFYRATLCASTVFAVGPCLYVHLSVTLVYCIQMAKDIVKLLSPPTSPMILVFWPQAPIPSSKGNPFSRGTNTRGGKKKFFLWFSTKITVYLGNSTRLAHGCRGMLIGSHRRRLNSCQFRWPWVTPWVTVYLQVEYLKNGAF